MPFLFAVALMVATTLPDPRVSCIYDDMPRAELRAALGLTGDGLRIAPDGAAARRLRIAVQDCQNRFGWIEPTRLRATFYADARATREALEERLAARGVSPTLVAAIGATLSPAERRALFIAAHRPDRRDAPILSKVAALADERLGAGAGDGSPRAATLLALAVAAAAGEAVTQETGIEPVLEAAGRSRWWPR